MRKVIDCFLYNGEAELVDLRIAELNQVVDEFWIIEGTRTFSGLEKDICFERQAIQFDWPLAKIHYFPFSFPNFDIDPWVNEHAQRNFVQELVGDCPENDLILLSDVDEIPRAEYVRSARDEICIGAFGFRMPTSYFRLNYVLIEPQVLANSVCTVGFTPPMLKKFTADELRIGIRDLRIAATIFENAGWHFSYMLDDEGIRRKIRSFSHQEFNTPQILEGISVDRILSEKQDLYLREGFLWGISTLETLPMSVLTNLERWREWLIVT